MSEAILRDNNHWRFTETLEVLKEFEMRKQTTDKKDQQNIDYIDVYQKSSTIVAKQAKLKRKRI